MKTRNTILPLRPDYSARTNPQTRSYWRGWTALALGTLTSTSPETIIAREWGRDDVARAASAVNTTTSTSAQAVVPIATGDTLITLAPASVAARLSQDCVPLNFDNANQIIIPKITTAPTATWPAEGSPAAMVQPVLGQLLIGPTKKLLFGTACTAEIKKYSVAIAQEIFQRTVTDAATVALDSALLDNAAADATRPAGLLNGLSTLGATSGGGVAALVGDLGKIGAALYSAKISPEDLILIMNPAQFLTARALLPLSRITIIPSLAVADKTIVAIAPGALAMYVGAVELEIREDGLVHMESTTPLDITTAAVSATVKSALQSNLFLIKVRLRAVWAPLVTGAVSMITSVTW